MKEEIKEKNKQHVLTALELYVQAQELLDKAEKEINKAGIQVCEHSKRNYHGTLEFQLYSGINRLEKLFDVKGYHPVDSFDEVRENQKAVEINGVELFQLGHVVNEKFGYR